MAIIKEFLAKVSESKKHKKLFLALIATVLLVAAIIGIVTGVQNKNSNSDNESLSAAHAIVKTSCSSTLYPELCFSTLATSATPNVTSLKDVIELSLNITITAVEKNFFAIEKLIKKLVKSLTKRERCALHDCLEMIDETLDELHEAVKDLLEYPSNNRSLTAHADDLKTLISSAITNQETCLDGFSHAEADKIVRKSLQKGQVISLLFFLFLNLNLNYFFPNFNFPILREITFLTE